MAQYIAFLRAINVGGHVVKMDVLKSIFESLGYSKCATFIASGNVLFESRKQPARLEKEIEKKLASALGYDVATFIRTPAELRAISEGAPAETGATLFVGFLHDPPSAAT